MIITGSPRSGTGYIAKLFTLAGLPCGHEQNYYLYPNQFKHIPNPQAESSWHAVPHLNKHKDIIHLVRNPIKVISSMENAGFLDDNKSDLNLIEKTLPKIKKYQGLERYVYFWTEWNKIIEKHTKNRYKVEDIYKNPRQFLIQFIEPKAIYKNDHYNSWGKYKLKTLDDIPKGKVKDNFIKKIEEYGYY